MTTNDRITELIAHLKIKQKDFAERIKIKPNTLSMIKNNQRSVTERVLSDICREFNVSKTWLEEGTGPMFNTAPSNYIDELIKANHLSPKDRIILEAYINMDEEQRESFYHFIRSFSHSSDS